MGARAAQLVYQLPSTQDLKGLCAQWFDYLEGTHLRILVVLFPSEPVSPALCIHPKVATGLPNPASQSKNPALSAKEL